MAVERTLTIIKPDAVAKGATGQIIARIEQAGLKVLAAKLVHLTPEQAGGFYIVHKERPFYASLCAVHDAGARACPWCWRATNAIQRLARSDGRDRSRQGGGGDDPQGLRLVDRGQRGARLRLAGVGRLRDPLLLQRPRDPSALTISPSPRAGEGSR